MNIFKKIIDFLTLFFAFSTTKHCEKWNPDVSEDSRTKVRRDKEGKIIKQGLAKNRGLKPLKALKSYNLTMHKSYNS